MPNHSNSTIGTGYIANQKNRINIFNEEYLDYLKCPAYYDMKHNRRLEMKDITSVTDELNKIISGVLHHEMIGAPTPFDEIKAKWDRICDKKKLDHKKAMDGIDKLIKFARFVKDMRNYKIMGYESEFKIHYDDYIFVGKTGLIVLDKNTKRKEAMLFNPSSNYRNKDILELDPIIGLTVLGYNILTEDHIDAIKVFNIKRGGLESIPISKNVLIDRTRTSIDNVCKAIKNDILYPRYDFMCARCEAVDYCRYYKKIGDIYAER